jgi:heme iron utilization protein
LQGPGSQDARVVISTSHRRRLRNVRIFNPETEGRARRGFRIHGDRAVPQSAQAPIPDLKSAMAAEPGALFETVAKERGATLREVVEALPGEMRRIAPGGAFVEAMGDIAAWGDVTFIVHADDAVFEFSGPVPAGSVARGYYNLGGASGLHGHLRHERCGGIAFVERPFFGRLSASVLFFNVDGGIMFKVFVGRDENRELKPDQLARFRTLAQRLGAKR